MQEGLFLCQFDFEKEGCEVIRKLIGHILVLAGKAANRCISAYLYSTVHAQGGGFIGSKTVLLHPESIYMGRNTYINGGMIAASEEAKIVIGDNCMISYDVHMRTDSHRYSSISVPMIDQGHEHRGIVVGDDVWIGYGAQIMSGVTVGSGSIVAAGAVVTKDVPEMSVVAGVPARVIKKRM